MTPNKFQYGKEMKLLFFWIEIPDREIGFSDLCRKMPELARVSSFCKETVGKTFDRNYKNRATNVRSQ